MINCKLEFEKHELNAIMHINYCVGQDLISG